MVTLIHKSGLVWIALCFMMSVRADKMATVSNVTAKIFTQGGKIEVYSGTDDSKAVQVKFDCLTEVDTDGDDVEGDHTFDTFETKVFNIFTPTDENYGTNSVPVTKITAGTGMGLEGVNVNFAVIIYIFKENGEIEVDGVNVTVKAGDVKFNVNVMTWPFCGTGEVTCAKGEGQATGQYLDFGVEMKGVNDETPELDSGNKYTLGNGTKLVIPKQVKYDGTTTKDMPQGYPQLVTKENKKLLMFRFEKFASSVLYDPIISMVTEEESDDSSDSDGDDDDDDDDSSSNNDATSVTMTESEKHVNVLKKSGAMSVISIDRAVQIAFFKITELKADGTPIVNAGGHVIDAFDDQTFTFSEQESDTLQEMSVKKMTYMTDLPNAAKLTITLYMFKEDGNFTNDDETTMVVKGAVKFTISITDWKYCGDTGVTCTNADVNQVGSHLEFDIKVTGSSEPVEQTTSANTGKLYDVGTAMVNFFTKYQKDGSDTFTAMPTGYPSYGKQGTNQLVTLRFEKSTSVVYDPVVIMKPDNGGSGLLATYMTTYLSVLFYILFSYL